MAKDICQALPHGPRAEQDEIARRDCVAGRHQVGLRGDAREHVNGREHPQRLLHHVLAVRQPPL